MKRDDEKLRRDLEEAYGRDLPGGEFDARVMQEVTGGGGEHEISAAPPSPRRALAVGGLLAASLLVLVGYGLGGGFVGRSGPAEGEGEWGPAAGGRQVRLPVASRARPTPRPIRVTITSEGEIFAGGGRKSLGELSAWLRQETRGTWHRGKSERSVILRADRRVRWREVQWVMQACAHPDVRLYRIQFQALPEEGAEGKAVLPAHLPVDRGLRRSDMPFNEGAKIAVELRRREGEGKTRVKLLADELGEGEEGFAELARLVRLMFNYEPSMPGEIDAGASVPHQDVVRALDIFLAAGIDGVSFVGTPPRGKATLEAIIEDEDVIEDVIEDEEIEEGK